MEEDFVLLMRLWVFGARSDERGRVSLGSMD